MTRVREVAESYWRAECRRDIEAVLAHYQPDGRFVAPGWELHGRDQIRKYYEDSAQAFPGLEVAVVGDLGSDEHAAVEWTATLIDGVGERWPISGVNVIQLRDGLFSTVTAYFDTSSLKANPRA